MGYTVVHKGRLSDSEYRDYLDAVSRSLLKQGISLDRVPRVREEERWLYVWPDEASAVAFAEELRQQTEEDGWTVRQVTEAATEGALRPLVLEVGWDRLGYVFGLHPLSEQALKVRFPECEPYDQVAVQTRLRRMEPPRREELQRLAPQALAMLTGLTPEQLSAFGGFEVVNPITEEVLLPAGTVQLSPASGDGFVPA